MMDNQPEISLDPENWEAMRALGHRMVDDMLDYLQNRRDNPVWQPTPDEVKTRLRAGVPLEAQGAEQAYEDFLRDVLPYVMGNTHPRFWGWVMGPGTPLAVLADMLASAVNPNMGGGEHASNRVEAQVVAWFKELFGYPPESSGLLVSGGSMANLVGLVVARYVKAGFNVRKEGIYGSSRRMMIYCSSETHSSVQKAVELMGLGSDSVHSIPVNEAFQIDTGELETAIAADRAAGHQPFCIVGSAGTTNTGAIDDLMQLASIAARENLWFHVDGAIGALLALSPDLRPLIAGMERADSFAFDLHKWLYMPFEVGCILVRSAENHRRAFSLTPEYLKHAERGLAAGTLWFSDYDVQLTRGFRALKVWLSLKADGAAKYGQAIQQNVEQARYLEKLVHDAPMLELLAPVALNIVCFRYRVEGWDDAALNRLNEEILLRLQESGIAVPSSTTLNGRYAIRVSITNHRSRRDDFDLLVGEVRRLGELLVQSGVSEPEAGD
jgi:aromatic-L-amino-acid/L-tryptophan decarboxylase